MPIRQATRAELISVLARNRAYRRDSARIGKSGALYMATVLIEGRLIMDMEEGRRTNMKRLIGEVAPEWISPTSALRLIHQLAAEGVVMLDRNPADGRGRLVRGTELLIERNEDRWGRIFD
jgi:hypothetical protein